MEKNNSYHVDDLRRELEALEKELADLKVERDAILSDPSRISQFKEISQQIKEKRKIIAHHKELIMILGDPDFNYEHGDVFDKLFTIKGERVSNPVAGI